VNPSAVASTAVMIFPKSFCANPDTLASNSFQSVTGENSKLAVLENSQSEFLAFHKTLTENGIKIIFFEEDTSKNTPDALFPNNWFCQLPDGRVFLFPMYPDNRRQEYRPDVIQALNPTEIIDLRPLVNDEIFLEGTGSLVFDHSHKIAFACRSSRTHQKGLEVFEKKSGYKVISFASLDQKDRPVYHTNVMMALSPQNAIICMESISSTEEREHIAFFLKKTGRKILDISFEEMNAFAGNMLFLTNGKNNFWICSSRAWNSLRSEYRSILEREAKVLCSNLHTIETFGGGGARCLLAECFKIN
jgi:hypothetical protein